MRSPRYPYRPTIDVLTVPQVAVLLRMKEDTVRRAIMEGQLAASDLNKGTGRRASYRICISDVWQFMRDKAVVPDSAPNPVMPIDRPENHANGNGSQKPKRKARTPSARAEKDYFATHK